MEQINSTLNPMQTAIDYHGAINKLAAALGVTPQAVSFWRDGLRQLPADKCPLIERLTKGLVTCEMLRPDVDWAYIRNTGQDKPKAQQIRAQAAPETVAPTDAGYTGPDRRHQHNPPPPDPERRAPLAAALAVGTGA